MEKKMEEMKKLISSLLVSCPLQMTVMKLDRDYAEQIGERIPFKKFGFFSLEECLRSMPDILELRGTGMQAEVSVKVSSKVAHIDKLISQQKVAPAKKSHFGTRPKRRPVIPRRRVSQPSNSFPFPPSNSNRIPPLYPTPPHIPPLLPTPRIPPLIPPQFLHMPHRMPSIPFHFDYNYSPLPIKSKNTVIPPVHNSAARQPPKPHRYSPPPRFKPPPPKFEATLVPSGQTLRQSSPVMNSSPQTPKDTPKSKPPDPTPPVGWWVSTGAIPKQANCRRSLSSPPPSEIFSDDVYISDSEDTDEYETYIPGLRNKAANENEFFHEQTLGSVHITGSAQDPRPTSPNNSNVPFNVQKNLRTLISKYDDGIWCAKLPSIYQKMFGKELYFMDYGYRSLITMCMELKDIFYCIRPDNGDFKLYDKQRPLPEDSDKSMKVSELLKACNNLSSAPCTEPALMEIENLQGVFSYPPDVMELYDEIPKMFLPPTVMENDYIDVKVGEVYDPSKFWILLSEHYRDFEHLMDDLQSFYSDCNPEYEIPVRMLARGLFCVAVYNHEYHRAIIVKTLLHETDKVKVFYIDYGTVSAVSAKGLYFLHRKFSHMPQQAIRARLAKIYPPLAQTQWSTRASSYLLDLVTNKVLVAQIFRIDQERSIVEIFLVDTTGDDDIFMNDALVHEGLAIFTYQEQEIRKLDMHEVPRVKHIHLFPTFNELELGTVPSAGEAFKLTRSGISVQVMYPHYFFPNYDLDDIQELDLVEDQDLIEGEDEYLAATDDSQIGTCSTAEPRWTELYDEELMSDDLKETVSNLSELTINSPSTPEPSPSCQSSPSPEIDYAKSDSPIPEIVYAKSDSPIPEIVYAKSDSPIPEIVYAKPVSRPPPGFEDVRPNPIAFNTATVNGDGLKGGAVVTQAANVNPEGHDVLLLKYMLACQQNVMLNQIPCQQVVTNIINPPMMIPAVVNSPINYFPKTQQMLLMPNQQSFAFQQPLAQPTSSNLLYQLTMQQQLRSQLNMQNNYYQAQNKVIDQQQKCREILQQIISQQLVNGNESLLAHLKNILKEHQGSSVFGQDAFGLLSSIIANQSFLLPGSGSSEIFNELLNMLSDNQIMELAQKAKELSTTPSSASNNVRDSLVTDSAPTLDSSINSSGLSNINAEVQVSEKSNKNREHKLNSTKKEVYNNNIAGVDKTQNKKNTRHRRHVIQINWNKKPVHVIWFCNNSYVIINEIMQFTVKKAAIAKIRKIAVMLDPSSVIIDLSLSEHPDIAQELLRYQCYDPSSVLHIIPTTFVPQLIKILGRRDNCTDCSDFLTKVDANSDVWLTT